MSAEEAGPRRPAVADEFTWFVGWDWGTATHVVDVGDAAGAAYAAREIAHTGAGLAGVLDWLTTLSAGQLERVAVAIEAPRGAVVETLLERGAAVFTLNPKQVDRFRDRFSVAGAKDDWLDARVLRSALRTDRGCFRRLHVEDPRVIQVRELTRVADDLAGEFQALANRLRDQVHRIAPEWLTLSTNADDPWFWKLLEQAGTPARARRLRRRTIEEVLRTYRIRRLSADEVVRVLQAPPVYVAPGTLEATTSHIALLLPRLRLVHRQSRECRDRLEALLADLAHGEPLSSDPPSSESPSSESPSSESPSSDAADAGPRVASSDASDVGPSDVAILQSLPGVGVGVSAALVADGMRLLRARDYAGLRATTGVAPVRRQTGKNKHGQVVMRYACNRQLREALYHWATISTHLDSAARTYYAALRARGHSHGRAARSVGDRWLRILVAMLTTRTLYDPARFAPLVTPAAPVTA